MRNLAFGIFLSATFMVLGGCAAHQSEPVAEHGLVVFRVEPGSAEVWVDGEQKGAASDFDGRVQVLELEAGTYRLELKAAGYATHTEEMVLGAGAKQTIQVMLVKAE